MEHSPAGRNRRWRRTAVFFSTLLLFGAAGCRLDMHDQPKYEPLEKSDFFPDSLASRQPVPGTVARGQLRNDEHLYSGRVNGELATTMPIPVTRELLERGRERYNIYCSPCHGLDGYGEGIIVKRGLRQPPSFHIDRLREESPGHYFDVMTNGLGAMFSYASRVQPEDRWAITAYIRALQLSQHAGPEEVPEDEMEKLRRSE